MSTTLSELNNLQFTLPPTYLTDYMPDDEKTISSTGTFSAFESEQTESNNYWFLRYHRSGEKLGVLTNYAETLQPFATPNSLHSSEGSSKTEINWSHLLESDPDSSNQANSSLTPRLTELFVQSFGWELAELPALIKRNVDLALAEENHKQAAQLAFEGHKRFPDDKDLAKIAEVLAPPKVLRRNISATPKLKDTMTWLKKNQSQYQGQWVAVQEGRLLAQAESRAELNEQLGTATKSKVLITKIPSSKP